MTSPLQRLPWREALVVLGVFFVTAGWVEYEKNGPDVAFIPIGASLLAAGALALWRSRAR